MGLLVMVGLVVVAAPETPTAQALMELASRQAAEEAPRGGDAVPTGLMLAAMGQAKALLSPEGVPLDGAAEEWLRERLILRLKAELAMFPRTPGRARRDAWENLTRVAMTPQFAQEALDGWLGLPPLEGLDDPAPPGSWTQVTQLEGSETFALKQAVVAEEVGSVGTKNALIDPGEWVRLELSFTNATSQPWFSSTGFARAQGCAWVDASRGSVLGEAAPGGQATLSLWLYLAEDCTTPSVVRVSVTDTHRGSPARGIALEVRPVPLVRPRMTNLRLDADARGSSDGSERDRIGPLGRFELVADLLVPGSQVSKVSPKWVLPQSATALFQSLTYRPVAAVPQGAGVYAAGDDLDGETVDADAWRALAQRAELEPWLVKPAAGRLWLALDTVVTMTATPPPAAPGAIAGAKFGAPLRPAPSAPPPASAATPVPVGVVTKLVQQYVSLTPHAVPREQPDAITAASGYEVVFDRAGFAKAYDALLAPPDGPAASGPATARYVTRTYVAVPAAAAEKLERAPLPEPPPEPPPRRAPRPRAAPKPVPLVQLDLGVGLSLFGTRPTGTTPNLWLGMNPGLFPTLGARAFIGPHVVGLVGGHLAMFPYTLGGSFTHVELSGELGIGYRARLGMLSFTPYAGLLGRLRTHSLFTSTGAFGGLLGVNARLAFTSAFGLALDLAVPLAAGGPLGRDAAGALIVTVDGVGLRATVNLSFTF